MCIRICRIGNFHNFLVLIDYGDQHAISFIGDCLHTRDDSTIRTLVKSFIRDWRC